MLSGLDALKLFVQSYQLLLRHQCHALIHKKGFPARLENIVKDLWALRLQLIEKRLRTSRDGESGAETGGETEAEESEGDGYESEINSKRLSKHERKKPTVLDSVSLCYFAMILLKIPISLGDIYR